MQIRRSKLPDPKVIGNAGSFFKNPLVSQHDFVTLQKEFANIPHFPTDSTDLVKISAGWLIEQCGWKGKRRDDIGVYDKQALVIVNYGNGSGQSIQTLVQDIQHSVYDRFGVQLLAEVNIV
jgi:UDP-N-acetylmuramate dehydrogenase